MYAAILAGGVGSRMWPKSRRTIPKQFLDLTGGETMLQTTVRRILPLVSPDKIFVITGKGYVPLVQEQISALPPENIIAEISGKNTAPAIGLGALSIAEKNPKAVMAVLTADHIIPNEEAFRKALQAADAVAQTGKLVTLGITPTGPETGYGYIHRGDAIGDYYKQTVYQVERFLEKPNLEKARKFYGSGQYYWNSGMFIWRVSTFFDEMEQFMPDLNEKLDRLQAAKSDPAAVEAIWHQVDSQSIDFGLMEKTTNVSVVPLDAGWNDVGSWATLYDELAQSEGENVVINTEHISVGSRNLLIQGNGKLVATIGVENLVIIETDDALLVCSKDKAQDVKIVVDRLKESQKYEYI